MNNEICNILKKRIVAAALPVVDRIAGVVQTVEFAEERQNGSKTIERIPMSVDTNTKNKDLIPNSRYRSLIYFEDNGITPDKRTVYGQYHTSRLTLVCWMNTKLLGTTSEFLLPVAMQKIQNALKIGKSSNEGRYLQFRVNLDSIAPNDNRVFARYTYDEAEKQYLMSPFAFFGINLSVKYIVSPFCNQVALNAVAPLCC